MEKEEFESMKFGADMFCKYTNPKITKNNERYKIVAVNFYEGLVELTDGLSDDRDVNFWVRHENIEMVD